ncbi:uncharacterized protein LOC133927441 [Phragmites australis]|uniref:uncharacterized protein LOC133927441 n=1 Tax=Phragmites australis TaxID=29695 RepID=UPI002D78A35B|nr:uncharacterized protein LOC133927441 [Phragmites australis]
MSHTPSKRSNPHDKTTAEKVIHDHKEMPSQPNVIARLMGIDAIPTPAKGAVIIQAEETSDMKPPSSTTEIKVISPRSGQFKQANWSLLSYLSKNGDSRHCRRKMRVPGRSRSRQRHPQEDLLEKIKEDFQAWQTSKALECARTVAALGNSSKNLDGRCIQIIAQENLRKEKMARYGYGNRKSECSLKNVVQESDSENAGKVAAEAKSEERVIRVRRVSHCATSENFRGLVVGKDGHNHSISEKLRSPARIVLLKPSSGIIVNDREPLFRLSKVKRDDNMEEFLQEVKERLQKELKVNATGELSTITWGTEPKQFVRDTAKHIKQTVTKDLGKRLSRSESFRAFRGDRKRNDVTEGTKHASPEHDTIDTRNILANRPESVTSRTETVSPKKDGKESTNLFPVRSRGRVRSLTDVSLTGIDFDEQSCTSECLMKNNILSPRILVRSFSAPESGISQGRLFLEDNVGGRKHEVSDVASESAAVTSKNSSSFSFRGTVSSLRHSFSLRRNLFGRKTHWSKKPSLGEFHPQMAIGMTPSPPETFNLFKVTQANFTELPPSPVSPLEVGHSSRHFFSDLNCTLPELSPKCPSEFEAPCSELSYMTVETACNQDKAYIREVLIAAGLYDDGSLDNKANARVDSMARPICDFFEEIEDIYYCRDKSGDHDTGLCNNSGENATDHRVLFDLANEALQSLVETAKTGSSLRQWVIDSTGVSRGRKLVDEVWQQVQTLRNPQMQEMQTIDSMVAYEIRKSAWAEVLYEDLYVVGRKIERAIFDELIEDIVQGFNLTKPRRSKDAYSSQN